VRDRREKRAERKKIKYYESEPLSCIVMVAARETDSWQLAREIEDRQLNYIFDYAIAHRLEPVKIVRCGCMGASVKNRLFESCIEIMRSGKADAILVADIHNLAPNVFEIYKKVGRVHEAGYRIISVNDGELRLKITSEEEKQL
jgi:DNA invertase Pin-like site-specific DNA recombinase